MKFGCLVGKGIATESEFFKYFFAYEEVKSWPWPSRLYAHLNPMMDGWRVCSDGDFRMNRYA